MMSNIDKRPISDEEWSATSFKLSTSELDALLLLSWSAGRMRRAEALIKEGANPLVGLIKRHTSFNASASRADSNVESDATRLVPENETDITQPFAKELYQPFFNAFNTRQWGRAVEIAKYRATESCPKTGLTALAAVALSDSDVPRAQIIKALLDAGANPEAPEDLKRGIVPLKELVRRYDAEAVGVLLEHGVKPIHTGEELKGSALGLSIELDDVEICEMMIKALVKDLKEGASMKKALMDVGLLEGMLLQYAKYHGALGIACSVFKSQALETLVKEEVNLKNRVNKMGNRSFDDHLTRYMKEVWKDSENAIASAGFLLARCIKDKQESLARALIEHGSSVEAFMGIDFNPLSSSSSPVLKEKKMSLLSASVKQGTMSITRALLDFGANPNQVDSDGNTPLFWAAAQTDLSSLWLLLEYGGKLDQRNAAGESVFSWAMGYKIPSTEGEIQGVAEAVKYQRDVAVGALKSLVSDPEQLKKLQKKPEFKISPLVKEAMLKEPEQDATLMDLEELVSRPVAARNKVLQWREDEAMIQKRRDLEKRFEQVGAQASANKTSLPLKESIEASQYQLEKVASGMRKTDSFGFSIIVSKQHQADQYAMLLAEFEKDQEQTMKVKAEAEAEALNFKTQKNREASKHMIPQVLSSRRDAREDASTIRPLGRLGGVRKP